MRATNSLLNLKKKDIITGVRGILHNAVPLLTCFNLIIIIWR